MLWEAANDLDYLGARLHGRRTGMAEAERLDQLCRLRSFPDLVREIYPAGGTSDAAGFQRRLVEDWAREMQAFQRHASAAGAPSLVWMLARCLLENLKTLLRGLAAHKPFAATSALLFKLTGGMAPDAAAALASAGSPEEVVRCLSPGRLRNLALGAVGRADEAPAPFHVEARLDGGYFKEWLKCAHAIPDDERAPVLALVRQELDIFNLMLALRGRFIHGMKPDDLSALHVPGGRISRACFGLLLGASDPAAAARQLPDGVLDRLPEARDKAAAKSAAATVRLEFLAWQRFWRLAHRAFRASHMGVGAVVGYAGLRWMEVRNLVTLAEGLRLGLEAAAIRSRLIPWLGPEAEHV